MAVSFLEVVATIGIGLLADSGCVAAQLFSEGYPTPPEPEPVVIPRAWFEELAAARIVEDPLFELPWN